MVKKNSVRPEDNKFAVKLFAKQLSEIEHFIFYGTLLGFVRDGMPITGDNDVDILVNQNHHGEVKEILKNGFQCLVMVPEIILTKKCPWKGQNWPYPDDLQLFMYASSMA